MPAAASAHHRPELGAMRSHDCNQPRAGLPPRETHARLKRVRGRPCIAQWPRMPAANNAHGWAFAWAPTSPEAVPSRSIFRRSAAGIKHHFFASANSANGRQANFTTNLDSLTENPRARRNLSRSLGVVILSRGVIYQNPMVELQMRRVRAAAFPPPPFCRSTGA